MASTILAIALLYFLAHGATALFTKTRVPDVLMLIVLGLVLGPILGLLHPEDFGKVGPVMTTLALLVILFDSGTTLKIPDLRASMRDTSLLAVLTFVLTTALGAGIGAALGGLEGMPALMLGAAVGGSSSAVVIPIVRQLQLGEPAATILITESALTDVLTIVGLFSLLQAWEQGVMTVGPILGGVLSTLVLATMVGVAGAVLWLVFLTHIRRYPNTLTTTLAFALILYGVAEMLGYSGAIAVLAFGIALVNQDELGITKLRIVEKHPTVLTDSEREFHGELVFIFKIFFFVYLGLSMSFVPAEAILALLIVLAAYAGRLAITRGLLSRKVPWTEARVVSYMVPKGLAAAVIASIPLAAGVPGGEVIRDTTYQVVLLSILLTAGLVPAMETGALRRGYRRLFGPFPEPEAPPPAESA